MTNDFFQKFTSDYNPQKTHKDLLRRASLPQINNLHLPEPAQSNTQLWGVSLDEFLPNIKFLMG